MFHFWESALFLLDAAPPARPWPFLVMIVVPCGLDLTSYSATPSCPDEHGVLLPGAAARSFPVFPLFPFKNFPAQVFSHPGVHRSPSEGLSHLSSDPVDVWWDPSCCISSKFQGDAYTAGQGTACGDFCNLGILDGLWGGWWWLQDLYSCQSEKGFCWCLGPVDGQEPKCRGYRKELSSKRGCMDMDSSGWRAGAGRTLSGATKDSSMDGPVDQGIFKLPSRLWHAVILILLLCLTFLSSGLGPLTSLKMSPNIKTIKKVYKWVPLHNTSLSLTTVGHGAAV